MSYLKKLYDTYEICYNNENIENSNEIVPVNYFSMKSHIEITISENGEFVNSDILDEPLTINIPSTKESRGRTSSVAPYPLCDQLKYVSGDYDKYSSDDEKDSNKYFIKYKTLLKDWSNNTNNPYVDAIYKYISKTTVISDLAERNCVCIKDNKLYVLKKEDKKSKEGKHKIFSLIDWKKNEKKQSNLLIRWVISKENGDNVKAWEDSSIINSWGEYYNKHSNKNGICLVKGVNDHIARIHQKKIIPTSTNAYLISENEESEKKDLSCKISTDVSNKSHNMLRWLLKRNAFFDCNNQYFIAWNIKGIEIPKIGGSSFDFLRDEEYEEEKNEFCYGDIGKHFSERLNKKIKGFKAKISDNEDILIMGLNSLTTGRISIILYKEMKSNDFFEKIENWHSKYAWFQKDKNKKFVGVPSVYEIIKSSYGENVSNNKKNFIIGKIIPCILEDKQIPYDILKNAVKSVNPFDYKTFEKKLSMACSLVKGYYHERSYEMKLDKTKTNRDYLFGRLLAVADMIESFAHSKKDIKRLTSAKKFWKRFQSNPLTTWQKIHNNLNYYEKQLGYSSKKYIDEISNIMSIFEDDDFNNKSLSGEFLMGYYTQRDELFKSKKSEELS